MDLPELESGQWWLVAALALFELKKGKLADLVLLEANPLEEISEPNRSSSRQDPTKLRNKKRLASQMNRRASN